MRLFGCLSLSGTLVVVSVFCYFYLEAVTASPAASQFSLTNSIRKHGILNLLAQVLRERQLLKPEPPRGKSLHVDNNKKSDRKIIFNHVKTTRPSLRNDLLRQELAKETKDNCLARLLCGAPPKPVNSTNPKNPASDYAYLVKEFFDFFVDDPIDEQKDKKKDEKDKDKQDDDDEDEDEENDETAARSGESVNITGSIVSDRDDVTTSTSATISSVTTGATITELPVPLASTNSPIGNAIDQHGSHVHKVTLEELIGDMKLTSQDFASLRQSRSLLQISMGELRQSTFINRKLREMRLAKSESKKLQIAGQIATTIRQPRQCRDFNNVASEILSTCPLTSEVVRYFNSNLKSGSQLALVKQSVNATEAGLVLLNDQGGRPHAYFLDNSPIVANTNINTDLKNPSVNDRFPVDDFIRHPIYENAYPQKNNVNHISLTNPPPEKKPVKEKAKDDDDEEESDENEDDDEDDEGDEEDDEQENEDEDNADDDGDDVEEEHPPTKERQLGSSPSSRQKYKRVRPQRKKNRDPGPPPGIIKVYGVPQPSFDTEFSHTSNQIGAGPVVIFDQDDYDSHIPHPGPPVQPPRSQQRPRPRPPLPPTKNSNSKSTQAPRRQQKTQMTQIRKRVTTTKPDSQSSNSEEDEEEEEQTVVYKSPNQMPQRPYSNPTSPYFSYGTFPAPRPEEYYRNGRPPRPRPPTPYQMSMNYRPDVAVRGRLNFRHDPGSSLMRPYYNNHDFRHGG